MVAGRYQELPKTNINPITLIICLPQPDEHLCSPCRNMLTINGPHFSIRNALLIPLLLVLLIYIYLERTTPQPALKAQNVDPYTFGFSDRYWNGEEVKRERLQGGWDDKEPLRALVVFGESI